MSARIHQAILLHPGDTYVARAHASHVSPTGAIGVVRLDSAGHSLQLQADDPNGLRNLASALNEAANEAARIIRKAAS